MTAEIGTRGRRGVLTWDLTAYRAELKHELLNFIPDALLGVPAATFNAGPTVHHGIEAGLDWRIAPQWRLRQTYAFSDFRFDGDKVYGDGRLPVVPPHLYRAELRYDHPAGWFAAPSLEWSMADAWVDYRNTLKSPSYTVANLSLGWTVRPGWRSLRTPAICSIRPMCRTSARSPTPAPPRAPSSIPAKDDPCSPACVWPIEGKP